MPDQMNRQQELQDFLKALGESTCSDCGEYFEGTRDTHQWCETCQRCTSPRHVGRSCAVERDRGEKGQP